jgi:hypothetical protein
MFDAKKSKDKNAEGPVANIQNESPSSNGGSSDGCRRRTMMLGHSYFHCKKCVCVCVNQKITLTEKVF